MGELPVLEAAGAVGQPERVGVGPVRAAHVDEQREGTALEHAVGHIEEPDAAGARKKFRPVAAREADRSPATSNGIRPKPWPAATRYGHASPAHPRPHR